MQKPAVGPIVAHNLWGFIRRRGVRMYAGMSLDEALTELYSVLQKNRDNDSFWIPLIDLMEGLFKCTVENRTTSRRRLTETALTETAFAKTWTASSVVGDLRQSVQADAGVSTTASSLKRFTSTLSGPVLAAFLMLGTALTTGCTRSTVQNEGETDTSTSTTETDSFVDSNSDSESSTTTTDTDGDTLSDTDGDTSSDTDGDTSSDTATQWFDDCLLDRDSILFAILDEAYLDTYSDPSFVRELLCECFAALNKSWSDGLTLLFSKGTDEEIAAVLDEMYQCCSASSASLDGEFDEDAFLAGALCNFVMPYKGVSFPSDAA